MENKNTKLKEYLQANYITSARAARELGYHPIYFNTIVNGGKPGAKMAVEISAYCKNKVKKSDLRPDLW